MFLGGDHMKIPKLPYGQGTISKYNDNLLIYKKTIKLPDGTKVRKSVYGKTPSEVMTLMKETEFDLVNNYSKGEKKLLYDAMIYWAENYRKPKIKSQSYKRIVTTIENQIMDLGLGMRFYDEITTDELQDAILRLNEQRYSRSTIKKTYDILKAFYTFISVKEKTYNPMLLVEMPSVNNILVEEREIQFFDQSDIIKFVEEAGRLNNNGTLKYKPGYVLAANIYLGMRIGELLALQWKDIDFEKGTIYVSKTWVQINNPEYNVNDPERMKELNIHKVCFIVQQSTKRDKNRYVPVNDRAKELLKLHYQYSDFKNPEDYVISTKSGKTNTNKNMGDIVKAICKNAETKIQNPGTHVLRHTCASLYFRAGVPVEVICKILGNSREVCEKTYIHFVEEQLQNAATQTIKAIDFF